MSTVRILHQTPGTSVPRIRRAPQAGDECAAGDVATLLAIEAAVARRWTGSSRRASDHEPCPRDLARAVLLQAGDHWGGRVWAAAAALVVRDTLRRWQVNGISPARAFSWLVELDGYLQAETEAVLDAEVAGALRRASEALLFEAFPVRWRDLAMSAGIA